MITNLENIFHLKNLKTLFLTVSLFYSGLIFFTSGTTIYLLNNNFYWGILITATLLIFILLISQLLSSLFYRLSDYTIRESVKEIHLSLLIASASLAILLSVVITTMLALNILFYLSIICMILSTVIFYKYIVPRNILKGTINFQKENITQSTQTESQLD